LSGGIENTVRIPGIQLNFLRNARMQRWTAKLDPYRIRGVGIAHGRTSSGQSPERVFAVQRA
jgi:hypothetical protein